MKAAIITTVRHNVGDDFVREGIVHLLRELFPALHVSVIHKHSPITAIKWLRWIRSERVSRYTYPVLLKGGVSDAIKKADIVIQSGAPVYWCHHGGPHCADNEWYGPLIRNNFDADRRGRRFMNVAGGSCQRFHSTGDELDSCPKCAAYIREFYDACNLTTLRDELARTMLRKAGRNADVLACTSIFARDTYNIESRSGDYIVLNFMEYGGHYTFGQNINRDAWRSEFVKLAGAARKMGRVVIACHTKEEERLAQILVPEVERFIVPDEHVEFMKFYSGAKFGVVNRVHAGFMMASFGKPVAVIGNDSRALMINNLGLNAYYVDDVNSIGVESILDDAASKVSVYPMVIDDVRRNSKRKYIELMSGALGL